MRRTELVGKIAEATRELEAVDAELKRREEVRELEAEDKRLVEEQARLRDELHKRAPG